jgi:hypothetical protein
LAVAGPDGPHDIAVEDAGEIHSVAARATGDKQVVFVVGVAIARVPIGNAGAVRRIQRIAFECLVGGEFMGLSARHVECRDDR